MIINRRLIITLLPFICGGVFILTIPFIAKTITTYILHQNGFKDASIEGFYITPHGIDIDRINLDKTKQSYIQNVIVNGSWFDIITKTHFKSVNIESINILALIDDKNQIQILGVNNNSLYSSKNSSSKNAPLPVSNLSIQSINFNLKAKGEVISTHARLSLQTKANGTQTIDGSIKSNQSNLNLDTSINATHTPNGTWNYKADIHELRANFKDFSTTRGSGWIEYTSSPNMQSSYGAQIDLGLIRYRNFTLNDANITVDSKQPTLAFLTAHPSDKNGTTLNVEITQTPNINLKLELSASSLQKIVNDFSSEQPSRVLFNDDIPFSITLEKTSKDLFQMPFNGMLKALFPTIPLSIDIPFLYDGSHLKLTLPQTLFDSSAINRIVNLNEYSSSLTKGTFNFGGDIFIGFSPLSIKTNSTLTAQSIDGQINGYPFKNLNTQISFLNFYPLETMPNQTASMDRFESGLPVTNIKMNFSIDQTNGFALHSISGEVASGKVETSPLFIEQNKPISTNLKISQINLKYLFSSKGSDLSADGLFSGQLPITFNDTGLHILNGFIQNDGGGVVRYTPAIPPAFMAGDDQRMKTLRTALSNYHFNSMTLAINGDVNGNLKTELKSNGTNPAFDERPIKLNLNVEGALVPAIKQALQPSSLSDKIEKEITKGMR